MTGELKIQIKKMTLDELNNDIRSKQELIDYFNLCAEEYFRFKHKIRIDKIIWKSWHSGMNYWYNNVSVVKELWNEELKENGRSSYYLNDKDNFFEDNSFCNS